MEKLPGQRKNTIGSIGQALDQRESFDLQVLPELGQSVAELRAKSRTLAARRRAGSQTRGDRVKKLRTGISERRNFSRRFLQAFSAVVALVLHLLQEAHLENFRRPS